MTAQTTAKKAPVSHCGIPKAPPKPSEMEFRLNHIAYKAKCDDDSDSEKSS